MTLPSHLIPPNKVKAEVPLVSENEIPSEPKETAPIAEEEPVLDFGLEPPVQELEKEPLEEPTEVTLGGPVEETLEEPMEEPDKESVQEPMNELVQEPVQSEMGDIGLEEPVKDSPESEPIQPPPSADSAFDFLDFGLSTTEPTVEPDSEPKIDSANSAEVVDLDLGFMELNQDTTKEPKETEEPSARQATVVKRLDLEEEEEKKPEEDLDVSLAMTAIPINPFDDNELEPSPAEEDQIPAVVLENKELLSARWSSNMQRWQEQKESYEAKCKEVEEKQESNEALREEIAKAQAKLDATQAEVEAKLTRISVLQARLSNYLAKNRLPRPVRVAFDKPDMDDLFITPEEAEAKKEEEKKKYEDIWDPEEDDVEVPIAPPRWKSPILKMDSAPMFQRSMAAKSFVKREEEKEFVPTGSRWYMGVNPPKVVKKSEEKKEEVQEEVKKEEEEDYSYSDYSYSYSDYEYDDEYDEEPVKKEVKKEAVSDGEFSEEELSEKKQEVKKEPKKEKKSRKGKKEEKEEKEPKDVAFVMSDSEEVFSDEDLPVENPRPVPPPEEPAVPKETTVESEVPPETVPAVIDDFVIHSDSEPETTAVEPPAVESEPKQEEEVKPDLPVETEEKPASPAEVEAKPEEAESKPAKEKKEKKEKKGKKSKKGKKEEKKEEGETKERRRRRGDGEKPAGGALGELGPAKPKKKKKAPVKK